MVWSLMFMMAMFLFVNYVEVVTIGILSCVALSLIYFRDYQIETFTLYQDSMGGMMGYLSILLTCLSITVSFSSQDSSKVSLCLLSGVLAFSMFHVSHLMMFFILFEASLIPLIVLIIGWGKQPERILAGQYIMLYTLMSSFPLLCLLVFVEQINGFFFMQNPLICSNYSTKFWSEELNLIISTSFMLTFLMKTPMFFIHHWLPKAHVEAPLEGSIILAGIMLKMGTFGVIRMLYLFPFNTWMLNMFIFSISILGSIISILMAVSSDDVKLSVAMSSVSHMNFLLCGIMSLKETVTPVSIMVMVSHGLNSSMLFFFVTIIYEVNNSRSILLAKGCVSKIPSILLMSFLFFSLSIAIPPSLPFLGEMITISCIWSFSWEIMPMVCLFVIINSFFSMLSYGVAGHSSFSGKSNQSKLSNLFNMLSSIFLVSLVLTFFFPEFLI